MDFNKLFRLMSLKGDFKWYETWDDDWDWLYDKGYISLDNNEIPSLTRRGERTIYYAVEKASDT